MTEQQLEARIEELTSTIESANEEKFELERLLREKRFSSYKERCEHWDPSPGKYFVCFTKEQPSYHSTIVKIYFVTDVDKEHLYMDTIETRYHTCDYEYWCKTEFYRLNFCSLEELQDNYTIYDLDATQAVILQNKLNMLSITYENHKEVEKIFAAVANRVIS